MSAIEQVEPKPDPPSPGAYIAALLEISFLALFAVNRSILGAVVWLVYFRFSALRALLGDLFRR